VAPRSVVFNWLDEARRFTPGLRVIELEASMTHDDVVRSGADLVVTTYGLLRHRIGTLSKVDFDYAILDEAHAVKNPSAATTAAARLLRASHRLALTGTPVENHLGELASLFDFLMPGLFGHAFRPASKRSLDLDAEAATRLGRGLRPFLLRRKKSDVLAELPPRIEQTIHCEMAPPQRAIYDEVRRHYQTSLLARVRRDGVGRSAVHVLEALLRLRQIACHPGLVDGGRRAETSAKLEALLEQLEPLVAQGKKALVFSQFTSLLDIVQKELADRKIAFERLDGTTRDRKERVARFQSDASCSVFLISLKAGGLGLNLTAAEYVFLLDPWWNPAAESQAIDRAHRMGQTRTVVSYRVLCKDTVEERVAELQEKKRALVESVFAESKTRLGDLSIEDVEALLS
jgi:SNF2 family DNA or RNA helicase